MFYKFINNYLHNFVLYFIKINLRKFCYILNCFFLKNFSNKINKIFYEIDLFNFVYFLFNSG